ncbi:glycosyltransferase family 9 protein [Aquabacterium sp. J223]|uniref:glycosyltransferase family 9 protein n=1 Tax=Aquabacterium sp. J223 TaxID=2898431 RepID=UPI0021AD91FD|nr:glycosyltransferase family 9 protein [Aquabacterium sp. J223]UUX97511.1 glycosyltransferase family 9 protein [Aquabacterium sp. J223]
MPTPPSPPPADPRRVLVIVTRQIGDVLLTTPLIRQAKRLWPAAQLDVLGFAGTLGMLEGNPDVHHRIEVREGSGWRQSWPLIRRLWRRYDLALVAQHTDRAHLYGLIAARARVGQVTRSRQDWWKRPGLAHAVELGHDPQHILLDKLRLLEPWSHRLAGAGTSVTPPAPQPLPPELLQRLGGGHVVLHPPSLVAYKQWPPAHYAAVAQAMVRRGLAVVLTGGPGGNDKAVVDEVAALAGSPHVIPCAGRLSLGQLTTLLSGARAYVGPDTSITHLAASCGTPTVAVYGPIDPRLWGPWPADGPAAQPYQPRALRQPRGNVVLMQGPQPCVPCNGEGCDKHRGSLSACLQTMAPERVIAELEAVLNRTPSPPATVTAAGA